MSDLVKIVLTTTIVSLSIQASCYIGVRGEMRRWCAFHCENPVVTEGRCYCRDENGTLIPKGPQGSQEIGG